MRTGRRFALTALSAIALAACTGSTGDGAPAGPTPGAVDRLLVLGEDGNVFTLRPDGVDRVAVTADAGDDLIYAQPTWSPTAERIAFTRVDARADAPRPTLVTTLADGSSSTAAATPRPPFYIHWSPSGERLVFLANASDGLDLRLVDVDGGGSDAETIATGSPFYLSWAADGDELVTHIGADGAGALGRLGTDGAAEPLPGRPGTFQAPQWSQAGDRLVYALADEPSQRLVVADIDGAVQQEVARFDGAIDFALDPAGQRLAFTVRDLDDAGDGGGLELVSAVAAQPAERVPPGVLVVADLDSGALEMVADGLVVLVQWAPEGDALLFATVEAAGGTLALRWQVWDGERVLRFARARPTATFAREYLPFFGQYSRSLTLWSPHGDAFTYAGRDDAGGGIWVQPVEADESPVRVSDGRFASWSPR